MQSVLLPRSGRGTRSRTSGVYRVVPHLILKEAPCWGKRERRDEAIEPSESSKREKRIFWGDQLLAMGERRLRLGRFLDSAQWSIEEIGWE